MTDSSNSNSITVPRDLIERSILRLTAAAISAEERGLLLGAQTYRTHIRELNSYMNPEAVPTLSLKQQGIEAGNRR